MSDDWVSSIASVRGRYIVVDAMGTMIEGVTKARETDAGVEVRFLATNGDGQELVGSADDGETLDPLEAHLLVPGGMIIDVNEDDEVD